MNKHELEKLVRQSTYKKRGAKTELYADIDGETKSLREWADFFNLEYFTVLYRYKKGLTGRDLIKPPRRKTNNYL